MVIRPDSGALTQFKKKWDLSTHPLSVVVKAFSIQYQSYLATMPEDDEPVRTPGEKDGPNNDNNNNKNPLDQLPVHRGIPLPDHMVPPGQDGYRTPTVEDYQRHVREAQQQQLRPHRPALLSSNRSSRARIPMVRMFSNLSSASMGQSILEGLEWRERIRHYTWTFFTMTMATGGIANVLYSGD